MNHKIHLRIVQHLFVNFETPAPHGMQLTTGFNGVLRQRLEEEKAKTMTVQSFSTVSLPLLR